MIRLLLLFAVVLFASPAIAQPPCPHQHLWSQGNIHAFSVSNCLELGNCRSCSLGTSTNLIQYFNKRRIQTGCKCSGTNCVCKDPTPYIHQGSTNPSPIPLAGADATGRSFTASPKVNMCISTFNSKVVAVTSGTQTDHYWLTTFAVSKKDASGNLVDHTHRIAFLVSGTPAEPSANITAGTLSTDQKKVNDGTSDFTIAR